MNLPVFVLTMATPISAVKRDRPRDPSSMLASFTAYSRPLASPMKAISSLPSWPASRQVLFLRLNARVPGVTIWQISRLTTFTLAGMPFVRAVMASTDSVCSTRATL